jgi:hypothetical protein
VVLVVSVVYRGCAIPVAWPVLSATEEHAWRREWLRLLRQVRTVVPRRFFVIVLADRGLYACWLFQRLVRLGWHPLLRINTGGTFRPATSTHYQALREVVPQPSTQCVGTGTAFRGRGAGSPVRCWRGGTRAIAIRGYGLPISRLVPGRRVGTAYGLGLSKA